MYYLGIHLMTDKTDPYIENYKILLREITKGINKGKKMARLWVGRCNIVKDVHYNQIYLNIHCYPNRNFSRLLYFW